MISCIIIDDEQHAVDLLTSHISKMPLLNLVFATTGSVEGFQYLQKEKPDLIFLDIQMPELDGFQFIRLAAGRSKFILTTAYAEHALKSYEHDVIDYLLKPISFERFLKSVQKAIERLTVSSPEHRLISQETSPAGDFIFVKTETRNKIVKILLNDIDYVEGLGNYVSLYTSSSRIVTLLSIKELEEKLPPNRFIRIHNSYLVPLNKINAVQGNQLHIGKHILPIGEMYRKAFLLTIDKHIINLKK